MKVVIQRVKSASVWIEEKEFSKIEKGFVVFLGVQKGDTKVEADYLIRKVVNMRIFEDADEKMNHTLADINGQILSISQFTLLANTKKGNRPSFIEAEEPTKANELYEYFNQQIEAQGIVVAKGQFGADMAIHLVNDGPVTITIDTLNK